MSESQVTTDHEQIRRWAEERKGKPATVRGTEARGDEAGILRIQFQEQSSDDLEAISWDEFFDKFEESDLAFLYQDRTKDGEPSRFFKLVDRKAH